MELLWYLTTSTKILNSYRKNYWLKETTSTHYFISMHNSTGTAENETST